MYLGGDRKKKKPTKVVLFIIAAIGMGVGFGYLLIDINKKKMEGEQARKVEPVISEDNLDPRIWGRKYPMQFDSYMSQRDVFIPTPFGGSLPYSKLIRYPQLTSLWAGYTFAVDFNEDRSHLYSAIDQRESKRIDTAYLNAHGFENFSGQPGTCLHCHSAYAPKILKEMGEEKFNSTPLAEHIDILDKSMDKDLYGAHLGSACSDCHSPDDMSLRITREHYIKAMVERGYERDEDKGLRASHQEMRTHVCAQCHTEYYFSVDKNELKLPWQNWPKNAAFKIEYLHDYYQDQLKAGSSGFRRDWTHDNSGAPLVKVQHPETELFASGTHSKRNVACADCHMPYKKVGAQKFTDHAMASPMLSLNSSCLTCHTGTEDEMRELILTSQKNTAESLRLAEKAIMSLIQDIESARPLIEAKAEKDMMSATKMVNRTLANARMYHRHASLRWDFIMSENSTGFHSPEESQRVLAQSIHYARRGQLLLAEDMEKTGINFTPSARDPRIPRAPSVIKEHNPPVGSAVPASVKRYDE